MHENDTGKIHGKTLKFTIKFRMITADSREKKCGKIPEQAGCFHGILKGKKSQKPCDLANIFKKGWADQTQPFLGHGSRKHSRKLARRYRTAHRTNACQRKICCRHLRAGPLHCGRASPPRPRWLSVMSIAQICIQPVWKKMKNEINRAHIRRQKKKENWTPSFGLAPGLPDYN